MLVSVLEFKGLLFLIKKIEIQGSGIFCKRKLIVLRIHPKLRLKNAVAALRPSRFRIDRHDCQGRGSVFHFSSESRNFHKIMIRNARFIRIIPVPEHNFIIIQFARFPDVTVLKLIGEFVQITDELILIRIQQIPFLQLANRFPVDSVDQSQGLFFLIISHIAVKFFWNCPFSLFCRCKRNPAVLHAGIPVCAVL